MPILRSAAVEELPRRANTLEACIERFIDLRNYGADTGGTDPALERWVTDDLLPWLQLTDVRHTLLELDSATSDRLAAT